MKLSIITVCLNIKNEIERTCESIINQTYQDFEWIVIDGGSTDGTLDILEKYKSRINILVSENDNGIYNAMNKGIKRSNGKYLNFMNGGDCFYNNNTLENAIKYFNTNADVYYSYAQFVVPDNKSFLKTTPRLLIEKYFIHDCIPHQSTFIKKELFVKYGYYNENFKIVSDYENWIIFMRNNCNFEFIDLITAVHYYDGISVSPEYTKIHSVERKAVIKKYFYNNFRSMLHAFTRVRTKKNKKRYLLFNIITLISVREYYKTNKNLRPINITIANIFTELNNLQLQVLELNKSNISDEEYNSKFEIIINDLMINIISENILNNCKLHPYLYDCLVCYKDLMLLSKIADNNTKNNIKKYFANKPKNYDDVLNIEKLIIKNKYQKKKKIYLFGFLPITK